MQHRVQKLLSNQGYCSRRHAEKLIEQGRVKVGNRKITLGDKAEENDPIFVDGKLVAKEKKRYLMLHKPLKYVTSLRDPYHKTVMELIDIKERVFPIGRLDYNTTGLLLLTNDGDFANKIMHPSHEITKTYHVEINKEITKKEKLTLERGVKLSDGVTSRAKIHQMDEFILEVTIHEGRNRIIRRMFEVLGFKVRSLKRLRVGKLGLGDLKPGKFKELSTKEKELVLK